MPETAFTGLWSEYHRFGLLLEALEENSFTFLFDLLEAACIPWLLPPLKPAV